MDRPAEPQIFETGGFRVDAAQRVLLAADGSRVPLSSRAFELLLFFLRHPGELLDKNRLMAAVWPDTVVEENNLTQSIGALRKALGEAPGENRFLVTEPGRGYRFVAAVQTPERLPPREAVAGKKPPWRLAAILAGAVVLAVVLWRAIAPEITDRSVAVMQLQNRSDAPEDAYLAIGIQDEVLTLLTRIGDLHVIPRASTERFAARQFTAPEIGDALGVAYVLQGNVQRAGERIRVSVALVDAARDRQVWASSYDRNAGEIFAIESEIAQDVAAAMQARLSVEERDSISQPPTAVPAAYVSYLKARAFAQRTTRTETEIHEAIAAYEKAVQLDPEFALAWAQLSRRHANLYSLGYDRSAERRDAAQLALGRALALGPNRLETKAARGYFLFVVDADLEGAERLYRELEASHPTSADATAGLAQILRELRQQERSDDYAHRTLALDPLNPYRHAIICQDFLTARELEVAAKTCARARELLPGDVGILVLEATIQQARGELGKSRELLSALAPEAGDWRSLRAFSRQKLLDRDPGAAVELLAFELDRQGGPGALGTRRGVVRRWLGDAARLADDSLAASDAYQLARGDLEAELGRQPGNPLLMAELAMVQARLGNRDAAMEMSRQCAAAAARVRRDWYAAECALANIQIELATGTPAEAVARIKDALALRGQLPPLTRELLRVDPEFASLQSREDFRALL